MGWSLSGVILALPRISSKPFGHGYSYRCDCLVRSVQMAHIVCSSNKI
jgi:hypothetical protein